MKVQKPYDGSNANTLPQSSNKENMFGTLGKHSTTSLTSSYQVPLQGGGMVQAIPLRMCLNRDRSVLAVVYTMVRTNQRKQAKKQKKYIHEIKIDFEKEKQGGHDFVKNMQAFCDYLCEKHSTYLNIAIISQIQVLDLLKKLWEMIYGRNPDYEKPAEKPKPAPLDNPKQQEKAAEAADQNFGQRKQPEKEKSEEQDLSEYADGFDDEDSKGEKSDNDWDESSENIPKKTNKNVEVQNSRGQQQEEPKKESWEDQQRRNLYFGMNDDDDEGKDSDNDLLDNIPSIGMDNAEEPEDNFNKVIGSGSGKGGLLGSLGITKEETAKGIEDIDDLDDYDLEEMEPQEKQEKEKEREGNNYSDLGRGRSPDEDLNKTNQSGMSGNGSEVLEISSKQRETIESQFKMLYDQDPELRKALAKSDVNTISLEDKFQIIEAYMSEGGVGGLQIQVEDEEDQDLELQHALENMSEEEKRQLNEQFEAIYEGDEELRRLIEDPAQLSLLQKYSIIQQFMRGQNDSSHATGENPNKSGVFSQSEDEIVEIEGKIYKRVQIEGQDQDFLMDSQSNIYDMNLKKIAEAGDIEDDQF